MTATTDSIAGSGTGGDRPTLTAGQAWRNVALMTLVLWVVLGAGCFGFGVRFVHARWGTGLNATLILDAIFVLGAAVVIAIVAAWQRSRGEGFRELGWRAPTRTSTLVAAVIYGALWTSLTFLRGAPFLAMPWQRPVMAVAGLVLSFGEEIAVRGFMMDQLHRARVPGLVQVLVTAVIMGVYHGNIGWHFSLESMGYSVVLFGLLSALYLWGRRSLTPPLVAHSMTHFFGDPWLLQGILIAFAGMRG